MNRKLFGAVIASLGLSLAQPAAAQPQGATGPQAGVKVGWLWPHTDLKETFGSTYVLGADVSYRGEIIGVGVDARYSRKKIEQSVAGETVAIGEAKWMSVPLSGNVYLNLFLDQGNTLYVGGGPTYMYTKVEATVLSPGLFASFVEGKWNWGWNAVVGADSGKAFIEGQYLWVKDSFGPEEVGTELNLGGLSVSLGVRF